MHVINQTLESLNIGQAASFQNLTIFPLFGGPPRARDYLTLREAIERGLAQITEVSAGGSVPELCFENTAKQPVLILDGEELIGAKQNRIANVTILAPAEKTITLPVSCVEAGRWSYRSDRFTPSDRAYFSEGRRRKTEAVAASMRVSGERNANQSEVWSEISNKAARMSVDSDTDAMADIYEQHEASISDYVAAFTAEAGQSGAVFAIGPRIEGLELFDAGETFAEMLPKLIRSYAIDAVERVEQAHREPGVEAARSFLSSLAQAHQETYPAVGLGTEVRLTAPGVVAAGLVEGDRVVHLVGFSSPAATQRQDVDASGLQAAHVRRRRAMGGR
jgi:hypothetical protein